MIFAAVVFKWSHSFRRSPSIRVTYEGLASVLKIGNVEPRNLDTPIDLRHHHGIVPFTGTMVVAHLPTIGSSAALYTLRSKVEQRS